MHKGGSAGEQGDAALGPAVLVVDDNRVNRKFLKALVERAGYRAVLAENGQDCLDRLGQDRFAAILMDVQMPVLDGLEATRRIRAGHPATAGIPIIAVTANAQEQDRLACLEAGMDDFVTKPVHIATLMRSLETAVSNGPVPRAAVAV